VPPVELDLVTRWTLYFFGSLAVGGVVGFLVAKLATFELGMGVGLLMPGLVSLSFTYAFVDTYRELSDDPARVVGTVVAVEDRPANASDSRVDHGDVNGFRREVSIRLRDGESGAGDIMGAAFVRDVDNACAWADSEDDALHDAGKMVDEAEVRREGDEGGHSLQ
jgi:predicted heme/steroid binding protein